MMNDENQTPKYGGLQQEVGNVEKTSSKICMIDEYDCKLHVIV
jgi:hypothetical protein